jgi:hypothetical protein
MSSLAPLPAATRETVFISHAAPEDNEFSVWLASKLALAGYKVWVDRQRLRGGDDFWDDIDRVLRNESTKQIVVFSRHVSKLGVKKELAIGGIVATRLKDPKFMIAIRADDVDWGDAPPEFVRGNILNAHPNWSDCLSPLFEALEESAVPKRPGPDSDTLKTLIEAREEGRACVQPIPEACLTNWFPVSPVPARIRYYRFEGLQDRMRSWLKDCAIPHADQGRLVGSFADPAGFVMAGPFEDSIVTAYDVSFGDFASGEELGPFADKASGSRDLVSLFRQHFDALAESRGLKPVSFASGEVGWFFPDDVIPKNKVEFVGEDGKIHRRVMSGKYRKLRWHTCLMAKPRIWPVPIYRILVNVVLSEDGKTPLPGDKTHRKRKKVTRSWWNDVWRDRMLAAMEFLSAGKASLELEAGNELFCVSKFPMTVDVPVSYQQAGPAPVVEEDDDGTIIVRPELDQFSTDLDDDEQPAPAEAEEETA